MSNLLDGELVGRVPVEKAPWRSGWNSRQGIRRRGINRPAFDPAGKGSRPFLPRQDKPVFPGMKENPCLRQVMSSYVYTNISPGFLLFLCKTTSAGGRRPQPGREAPPFLLKKRILSTYFDKNRPIFPRSRPMFPVKSEKRPPETAAVSPFTQNPLKTFLCFV